MNSGVRLSVAIIVIIVIALGVYYASLGEDEGNGLAVIEPVPPVVVEELEPTPEPGPDPVPVPMTITEPVVDPASEVASNSDAAIEEELLDESEPDPNDIPGDDAEATTAIADASSDMGDVTDDAVEAGASNGVGDEAVADPATTDVESGVDGMEPTNVEPLEPAGTDEPSTEPADDGSIDATDEGADSETETIIAADRSEPGRPTDAAGLGAHRLALDGELSTTVTDAARDSLGAASADVVLLRTDPRLSWLAVPANLVGSKLLEEAITARGTDEEILFVLVREDLDGTVSLDGRVATAESSSLPGSDLSRIRFRITPDAIDDVRTESGRLTGAPVAWVLGGELIALSKPQIAISQRGLIPTEVPRARAAMWSERITTVAQPRRSSGSEGPAVEPGTSATGSRTGRPARAGELPEDAYTTYVVQPGDTPSSIALAWFGADDKVSLLLTANPLVDPNRMMPGTEIRLPPKDLELRTIIDARQGTEPVIHRVQSGETLSAIALAAYGNAALWPRILEANRDKLTEPSQLRVGMELLIP